MVKACMKTVLSQPKPPDIEHLSLVDADLKLKAFFKAKLKVSNQTNTEL